MLARLAENLFWTGRYLERAEGTSRLVDVTYHLLLESPPSEIASTWEEVLDQLRLLDDYARWQHGEFTAIRPQDVLRFLVAEQDNPSSITAALARVRENARSVRELISTEVWQAVNDLHLRLGGRDVRAEIEDRPYEVFRTVTTGCQTIIGVIIETMPRDEAFRFLTLGRMLERAQMTSRFVDARYAQLAADTSFQHQMALLRSIGALESFRRRFGASTEAQDVLALLLLDGDHPRSVLFALDRAEEVLGHLPTGSGRSLRAVGRTRAGLRYRDVDELLDAGLHDFLVGLQQRVAGASDAIADEFFRHVPPGSLHTVATT